MQMTISVACIQLNFRTWPRKVVFIEVRVTVQQASTSTHCTVGISLLPTPPSKERKQDVVLTLAPCQHRPAPLYPLPPPAYPRPIHLHPAHASNRIQSRLLMDAPQPCSCFALHDVYTAHARKVQRERWREDPTSHRWDRV